MTKALRLQVVERFDELPVDARDWNRLVSQSETNTIFQTYEWFASWNEVFGDRCRLLFLLVFDGARLVGVFPLMRSGRSLRFASDRYADYCDVIAGSHKENVLHTTLRFLAGESRSWRAILLQDIPDGSTTPALLKRIAPEVGLRLLVRGNVACPAVVLAGSPDPAARVLRKQSLRRPHNFFHRSGRLAFRHVTDVKTVHSLLPQFFAQHVERWRRKRSTSLFLDDSNRRFYNVLVERLLPRGWLAFSVVEYNDEPIAFHLGFDYCGSFLWYKPSFDIRLERYSPGNVLLRYLLEHAVRSEKKEFDFTVGDEAFKRRYSNFVRYNTNILLSSGLRSHALALGMQAAKRLARLLLGRTK